ncbi:hypothetical protein [Chitinophaga sp. sic0106]|uniref:hypothetical protein n=1 Tax=Chitinophaga sp. sic0106 TaxID=2854785 RepID=UPI001C448B8B|nr:hypothetical protein [Chitinophaga sp. sic0106]MBV7531328.1 hypothetical protein [Chitinophaga sp. sic0106]
MTSQQNSIDYARDQMQRGLMTAAQANVYMVQMEGVRLITGKIPAEVRKALNAAVKAGELGHIKKDGLKPEAYHHKNARGRAIEMRDQAFRASLDTLKNVFA